MREVIDFKNCKVVWKPELAHLHPELPFQQYQTPHLLSHHMPALDAPAMGIAEYEDDEIIKGICAVLKCGPLLVLPFTYHSIF